MNEYSAYVGLDIHKDSIAVAVALPGRQEPTRRGEIKNQRKALLRLIDSISPNGKVVSFCYEAGLELPRFRGQLIASHQAACLLLLSKFSGDRQPRPE